MKGARFDIEPDVTARVLRLGYCIHEVPIRYYARSREEGKKLTWKDGVRAIVTLLKIRLSSHARLFGSPILDGYHLRRKDELSQLHPLISRDRPQPFEIAQTNVSGQEPPSPD